MITGIFFILAGIMLVVFPKLLALMVAAVFILIGLFMMHMSFYYKRMARKFNDPVMDFMFRF